MNRLVIVAFSLSFLFSCKKDHFDPEPPKITFDGWNYIEKDANGHDSKVELVIGFKDRNGDIGRIESEKNDKCGRPISDLFIYYEQKVNNSYTPAYWDQPDSALDANCNLIPGSYTPVSQINFVRALDYIQPEGNNRSIEGEITYILGYDDAISVLNSFAAGRCRVFLMDRARNKSNEVYTSDLILH